MNMDNRSEGPPKGGAEASRRSEATEREYERRARRFLEWLKSRSMPADWQGLVLAYEALTRDLKPASRRQYRAALRFWIERYLSMLAATQFSEQVAEIDRRWRAARKGGKAGGGGGRKGGGLLRQMPEEVRRQIATTLYALGTTYGLIAGDIILAGPVLGLRPKEWAETTLEGDVLRVKNSKYIEGLRANGPVRELVVDRAKMAPDEIEAMSRLVLSMQGRTWAALRPKLQPVLKAVIGDLVSGGIIAKRWKRLRFYDARHQYAAELKATLDATKGEVAAAMGHASAMTALHHYGRRKRAERPSAVRPTAESVAAVKANTVARLTAQMVKRRRTGPEGAAGPAASGAGASVKVDK